MMGVHWVSFSEDSTSSATAAFLWMAMIQRLRESNWNESTDSPELNCEAECVSHSLTQA